VKEKKGMKKKEQTSLLFKIKIIINLKDKIFNELKDYHKNKNFLFLVLFFNKEMKVKRTKYIKL